MADRSVAAHRRILHISYYDNLLKTRAALMERSGYAVTSVLGNEQAMAADGALSAADLVVIGFSGPYVQRSAIVHWLKQHHPEVPIVIMQARSSELFPEADYVTTPEHPKVWMDTIARCLEQHNHHAQ